MTKQQSIHTQFLFVNLRAVRGLIYSIRKCWIVGFWNVCGWKAAIRADGYAFDRTTTLVIIPWSFIQDSFIEIFLRNAHFIHPIQRIEGTNERTVRPSATETMRQITKMKRFRLQKYVTSESDWDVCYRFSCSLSPSLSQMNRCWLFSQFLLHSHRRLWWNIRILRLCRPYAEIKWKKNQELDWERTTVYK